MMGYAYQRKNGAKGKQTSHHHLATMKVSNWAAQQNHATQPKYQNMQLQRTLGFDVP
jgi:hypothetical protein